MFPMLVSESLAGVVFTDFGTVQNNVAFDQFRLTVGAGLRVTVPQISPVPLAFDWGYAILRQDDDRRKNFSFSIRRDPLKHLRGDVFFFAVHQDLRAGFEKFVAKVRERNWHVTVRQHGIRRDAADFLALEVFHNGTQPGPKPDPI